MSLISTLVLAVLILLPWASLNPPASLREDEMEAAATVAFPLASAVMRETAHAADVPAASAQVPAGEEIPTVADDLPN